jgi:hypothetical protein
VALPAMNWALTAPEQIIAVNTAGSSAGLGEDAIETGAVRVAHLSARRNPAQAHRITHQGAWLGCTIADSGSE